MRSCSKSENLVKPSDRDVIGRAAQPSVGHFPKRERLIYSGYSPLGGPGANLLRNPTLARIGEAHGCSAAAVALAWTIRGGNVIAIPESGSVAHVKKNAVALKLTLTPQELQTLETAYPLPHR